MLGLHILGHAHGCSGLVALHRCCLQPAQPSAFCGIRQAATSTEVTAILRPMRACWGPASHTLVTALLPAPMLSCHQGAHECCFAEDSLHPCLCCVLRHPSRHARDPTRALRGCLPCSRVTSGLLPRLLDQGWDTNTDLAAGPTTPHILRSWVYRINQVIFESFACNIALKFGAPSWKR